MSSSPADKYLLRLACCRPDAGDGGDRRLREAFARLPADPVLQAAFTRQTDFDRPFAALVQGLLLPPDFDGLVRAGRRRATRPRPTPWRSVFWQPAAWAVGLAFLFLAGWGGIAYHDHLTGFGGDDTVRQMVETTRTGRGADRLQPLDVECGKLGDTLFLQYGLEDYSVPPVFDRTLATGYRVFAKNEKFVAQVRVQDHGMTFLVFRADQQNVSIDQEGHWKFLHGDGWSAAVQVRGRIGFVAVYPGAEAEMRTVLTEARARVKRPKTPPSPTPPVNA